MAEPFLGEIRAFGFNFPPRGWAQCDGQTLPINQNTALFALLGTIYGGDGETSFRVPDLRGRMPMHFGSGPGLSSRQIGQTGGSETVTLADAEMPPHSHGMRCSGDTGNSNVAEGNYCAEDAGFQSATYSDVPDASMGENAITESGGGRPHENMSPYLALNFCIALVGIFPSQSRPAKSK